MLQATMMYRRMGQSEASVAMAMQTMDIARHVTDPLALTYAHQGLGMSYEQSGRYSEAHEHYQQMRKQARAAHSKLLEATALSSLGNLISRHGGAQTEGEALIRESGALFRAVGVPFGISGSLYVLAQNMNEQRRYRDAIAALNEAITIYERYPNRIGLWYALNARSSNYQSLGNVSAARADTLLAYGLAKDIGFSLYLSDSTSRMAALAAANGDHQRAYQLALEARVMADNVTRENGNERMMELAQQYQSESKQHEIDELTRRNEQQTAELQRRMLQERWLWTVLLAGVIILVSATYFLTRLRRSNSLLTELNAKVQQSENQLKATFDAIPDVLFVAGLDGRYYEVHTPRTDLLAAPVDVLVGRTVFDVMSPESAGICVSALQEAYETGFSNGKQIELALPRGKHWFELSIARKTVVEGQAPRFIVLSRDVTERKHQEGQEETRRQIFERLAQGGDLPEILNLVVRYVERPRPDLMVSIMLVDTSGTHLVPVVAPSLPADYVAAIGSIDIAEGVGSCGTAAWRGERVIIDDLSTHPFWAASRVLTEQAGLLSCWSEPIFDSFGKVLGTFCIYRREVGLPDEDTMRMVRRASYLAAIAIERKQIEDALRESEQQFRALAENAPDHICRYDRQCRMVYLNQKFESELRASVHRLRGMTPTELFPGEPGATLLQASIATVIETGLPSEIELALPDSGQGLRYHNVRLVAERGQQGDIVGVLAIGRDITERKHLELHLEDTQQLLRQLAARNESAREDERKRLKRELHDELGQYLLALRLGISVVDMQFGADNAPLREKTQRLIEMVDTTIKVVRHVVASLRPAALDMGIVSALEWLADEYSERANLQIELHTPEEEVCMDDACATAIFRIVQESLTNVVRYAKADKVDIRLECEDAHYILEVRDNGVGFDPALRKEKSFGLISIRERAIMLGGDVEISSAPGQATVIRGCFPVHNVTINGTSET
jgi:PAS domain S-box-containing protein